MPTYEYQCQHCGYEFEQFQNITSRPLRKCPKCGRNGLKRLIGLGAGVIFKGSGFYQTDYRSEDYKQKEKKENQKNEKTGKKKETESTQNSPDSAGNKQTDNKDTQKSANKNN